MVVIVDLAIVPMGSGVSVSKFVAEAKKELERRKVKHHLTPMSTVYEAASVGEAFEIAKAAHEAVFKAGVSRLVTILRIDDRRDAERKGMEEKVKAVEKALGD